MKILFVCLGNICRSPMAEGIMLKKINDFNLEDKFEVDSAGFEPFHNGDPPDNRAIETAEKFGVDLKPLRARLFRSDDFDHFDMIYVMDHKNYRDVVGCARNKKDQLKIDYLMNVLEPGKNLTVPDPWNGDNRDFEKVFNILDKAVNKLLSIKPKPRNIPFLKEGLT